MKNKLWAKEVSASLVSCWSSACVKDPVSCLVALWRERARPETGVKKKGFEMFEVLIRPLREAWFSISTILAHLLPRECRKPKPPKM